jgi:hypothetical protein
MLFFIPGTPQQVRTTLQALVALLEEYGELSGDNSIRKIVGWSFRDPNPGHSLVWS